MAVGARQICIDDTLTALQVTEIQNMEARHKAEEAALLQSLADEKAEIDAKYEEVC